MTGFKDTTNPWDVPTNAHIADHAHSQGGHVNYTHPPQPCSDPFHGVYSAKELPVDVALGKIDSLDINGRYDGDRPIWYRLLNCGFHLPASAGTDVFLNRVSSRLPGGDRAYVRRWVVHVPVLGDRTEGRAFIRHQRPHAPVHRGWQDARRHDRAGDKPGKLRVQGGAVAAAPCPLEKSGADPHCRPGRSIRRSAR